MIAGVHDNKGIAEMLGIQIQTVKNHTSNVLGKMQAKNRTHAAMIAISKGWLDFPIDDGGTVLLGADLESFTIDQRIERDSHQHSRFGNMSKSQ